MQNNKPSEWSFKTVVMAILLIVVLIIIFSIPGKYSEFSKEASRKASERREMYNQKLRNNPANSLTGRDMERLRSERLRRKNLKND